MLALDEGSEKNREVKQEAQKEREDILQVCKRREWGKREGDKEKEKEPEGERLAKSGTRAAKEKHTRDQAFRGTKRHPHTRRASNFGHKRGTSGTKKEVGMHTDTQRERGREKERDTQTRIRVER